MGRPRRECEAVLGEKTCVDDDSSGGGGGR